MLTARWVMASFATIVICSYTCTGVIILMNMCIHHLHSHSMPRGRSGGAGGLGGGGGSGSRGGCCGCASAGDLGAVHCLPEVRTAVLACWIVLQGPSTC